MSSNPLIEILEANRLLRSQDEALRFEQTLETLAQNPDPTDLPSLHLIFDDACERPEVLFSLLHFLESFEVQAQIPAFIQVIPEMVKRSAKWTAILHSRITNDPIAQSAFEETLRSLSSQEQTNIENAIAGIEEKRVPTVFMNIL